MDNAIQEKRYIQHLVRTRSQAKRHLVTTVRQLPFCHFFRCHNRLSTHDALGSVDLEARDM